MQVTALNETIIMLVVLALIDVVMISNLLIMVIVGGYETFVSRMDLEGHPDQPEWLSHVNASVLKVKLATAIIGISSIHLLKTFINAANYDDQGADVANHHSHHVPAQRAGDCLHRPADDARALSDGVSGSPLQTAGESRFQFLVWIQRRPPSPTAGRPPAALQYEPSNTPNLTCDSYMASAPSNASEPIKRLIVKPTPHSTHTPKT